MSVHIMRVRKASRRKRVGVRRGIRTRVGLALKLFTASHTIFFFSLLVCIRKREWRGWAYRGLFPYLAALRGDNRYGSVSTPRFLGESFSLPPSLYFSFIYVRVPLLAEGIG
ncbi:hypothetical protein NPIL_280891 [Nephila pilipes]|uniref:Transmembrane protein n=1 Tax=Nephila pilipes TaxID=299642 RepID=A0A8X6MF31_NEPPI|nr:hypothetical protein NPIL_280891 [Nephila pilipes]